jgi:all-trans-retinol 13,14-reductase
VRFLISTRTGGHGSQFVQNATPGTSTEIELPLGQYTLTGSGRRQVFIATGTGLAPFLPMFQALQANGTLGDAVLFFGHRNADDDITVEHNPLPGRIVRCVSGDTSPRDHYKGRVTGALETFEFEPDATDFYVCGSSAMIADCRTMLEGRGAKHLFIESF